MKRGNTKRRARISLGIVIICVLTFLAISKAWGMLGFLLFIILSPLIIIKYIQYRRRRAITSNIDHILRKALKTMDSTARWYNNEEEANRELVTCLKAQGINDVQYQYRLNNGRAIDARVGNMLIEGKLSPDTKETDRLLGQLSEYTRHGKINVVIYGSLQEYAKRRIESEIRSRYHQRAFLTYLEHPRRQRNNHH